MAGAVRFELTTKVLETHVLPLHHAPTFSRTYIIIHQIPSNVNRKLKDFEIFSVIYKIDAANTKDGTSGWRI